MNSGISEREKLKEIEEFATSKVRARASEVDETSTFPVDLIKEMSELGVFSIYIPKEYGGLGLSLRTLMETIRIISRECASTSLIPDVTVSLFGEPILKYGTESLKQKYLSRIAKGTIGALAITEPGAGSDAAAIKTTAVKKGEGYVVNGAKTFITNGGEAEFFLASAVTAPEKKHHGITLFAIDREMSGLSIGKEFKKMGIRGTSTTEVLIDSVEVGEEQIVGKFNEGFRIEMDTLNVGRIGIASQAIGIAEGAVRDVIKFNEQFKGSNREGMAFKLADMINLLHSSVAKYNESIEIAEARRDPTLLSSLAKLQAGDAAVKITADAVELLGYRAMTSEYPTERRFREAKITQIYEGTNEIQRVIIAREILKMGGPSF
ncbi:MAG: acyl-CoA dehydrogenase family protein [Thermoplasmatales archaeon]|jgi:alkylation response protein AidB-like acyl-CoA dehydrogenase|nr:acyl-CoA dehydrogenase family protein [Candidatus Thermoplasmatota archaeon]MCL6002084.1 acyl-CoA dehydrogenase family protein [Candidatus Thermoplasmatota archaeon]MDA8055163.1 acyl-CoA dehydrogenase family protein [Thermoplasmatales archaeon]